MDELTEAEKKFLVLAIQGLSMRSGPSVFELARQTTKKLGIYEEFQQSLKDWISYGTNKGPKLGEISGE